MDRSFVHEGEKYMKCKIIGKNVAVTDSIKSAIEEKLRRMDKYFIINEDIVLVSKQADVFRQANCVIGFDRIQ